jgi:hypothetical protein
MEITIEEAAAAEEEPPAAEEEPPAAEEEPPAAEEEPPAAEEEPPAAEEDNLDSDDLFDVDDFVDDLLDRFGLDN